jgi:hypothetical protein
MVDPERRAHLAALARYRASAFGWEQTWRAVDDALDAALADVPAEGPRGALPATAAPPWAATPVSALPA